MNDKETDTHWKREYEKTVWPDMNLCSKSSLVLWSYAKSKGMNAFLCLLLPALTCCSALCTVLIWVCICNICCLDRQILTAKEKVEWGQMRGKERWDESDQTNRSWLDLLSNVWQRDEKLPLVTPNSGLGCSFQFLPATAHLQGGRTEISLFPLL